MPYIKNYFKLNKIDHGPVNTKFDLLSKYDYCLCIENMYLEGYITEKIFDCFFLWNYPIYKGSSDIKKYLPEDTFIFIDDFNDTNELIKYTQSLSENDKNDYRDNMIKFFEGPLINKYYYSIDEMFD